VTRSSSGSEQANGALLTRAFQDFDHAAGVLQQSYAALTTRLHEMDLELAQTNATLRTHLRETENMRAHLTAILESLDTGVLVTDCAETVTRCNAATERMLGVTRDALIGRPIGTLLHELHLDGKEYPLVLPNHIAVSLSHSNLKDLAGRPIGALHLLHDVTTVRHLEARLQRRNRLAAMGEMIGSIAHEIRNPLGSVELFASMLRKDLKDAPHLRRYAEHISMAVQSMDRLLSNLLLYTKPDRSKAAWHETEPLIIETLTMAAHMLSSAPIDVRIQLDPLVPQLWCDVAQMKQVLLNLIMNAVHAMPEGGTLTVTVSPEQNGSCRDRPGARLVVGDTGCGIPAEQQSRIFDPFFTTKDDGTGLGLAIVHALVEAHRGRIDVDSSIGTGTSFIVTLPGSSTVAEDPLCHESVTLARTGEEIRQ